MYVGVDNVVAVLLQHLKVPEEHFDTKVWRRPRFIGSHILWLSLLVVDEILSTCTYNEHDQLKKLVTFWILRCPLASWRWLIWRLEDCHLSETAKEILHNAEPLTGIMYI